MKIYNVCQLAPQSRAAAAATVIADRLAALVAIMLLASVSFILRPVTLPWLTRSAFPLQGAVAGAMTLAAATALLLWLSRRSTWIGKLGRLALACRRTVTFNATLLAAFALALAVHFLAFVIVFFYARALHIGISYPQILLIMPVVLLLIMLPVTINGHGLRELLLITYFTQFGITLRPPFTGDLQEIVVALSILLVASDLFWGLPGGIWYFATFRRAAPSPVTLPGES